MTLESLLASLTAKEEQPISKSSAKSGDDVSAFLAENDAELKKLMEEFNRRVAAAEGGSSAYQPEVPSTEIVPEPGFVIKTHNQTQVGDWPAGLKVFINICHSPHVPAPPLASDEEIRRAINAEDNAAYKVPLSLSSPKADRDKTGKTCLVFDACVNTDPLNKALMDMDFKLFLIELSLEWVEEKHKLDLSREFTIPKLRSKGPLSKHIIRRTKRPVIAEVDPNQKSTPKPKATPSASITPISTTIKSNKLQKLPQPVYTIVKEPPEGETEYLVVEVSLPDIKTTKTASLDIEERQLILSIPDRYYLEAPLPSAIDTREGGAQFDRGRQVLTVTLKC
ncbi:uncharacterized protein SPPG_02270 [Spizellomyces punctatus DAOM BR117]|uniref:PIH1 domain-containing protein 1 n=1 Tax=Spizellomyces punctatus (strain DAOM BR117) TaxID=645134 RepID=A0A0L0HQV5_SPIPD|nr:uncharacterized protein SPPG_02270 [Spizellomyces punctatus DAOM BR117]KND03214.1 hypothetical protein SPPG_02270 [Spizellomyces punctatus DAOM BR117]|eukprot:XP_016611253.1 hypothetical protein SPPG_02270 [Spizellomyces punctatus DAOM BR117]